MTHTTSPYCCMIATIFRTERAVQSVNRDTSSGTLSTCSMCGRMLSMPRGSFAWKIKKKQYYKVAMCMGLWAPIGLLLVYTTIKSIKQMSTHPVAHVEVDGCWMISGISEARQRPARVSRTWSTLVADQRITGRLGISHAVSGQLKIIFITLAPGFWIKY